MKPAPRSRVLIAALAGVVALLLPITAEADVGYQGPSYGNSTSKPTAEKPQSKTWFHDGRWWGGLYNKTAGRFEIYYLDSSKIWRTTGVAVDSRENSRADFLKDGNRLYAVSAGESTTNTGSAARLRRYSYDATARKYTLDAAYPVDLTTTGTASITIAKDDTGTLWATYAQGSNVYVTHSTTDDATWRSPYVLPAPGADNVKPGEDESAIVAFDDQVGVMWSNQTDNNDEAMYWATHTDGAPDGQWVPNTARRGAELADNHINLKALDGDPAGQVFAATKTSLDRQADPLIELLVLDDGVWTRHVVGRKVDNHTRAITAIDPVRRLVYVIASAPCCSGGDILYKQASLDDISFGPGQGVPFIQSSSEIKLNNPTSTKQPVTSASGLLAVASDDETRRYGYNIDADAAPDTSIQSGPSGTSDSADATFTAAANQQGATLECRLDGAAFAPCSSPKTYQALPDGQHTFQVRAVTAAGGPDPTPAERTWTVDSISTTATFPAIADSFVDGTHTSTNYGAATDLSVDASPQQESYLRFAVGGLLGPVRQATLRLYVTNGSINAPAVYTTSGSWTEGGVTFQNRPAATSTAHDDKAAIAAGTWLEYDVTPFVTADGEVNLKLITDSSDGMEFPSREAASKQPQLVVRHHSAPPRTTIGAAPSDPASSPDALFTFSSDKPGRFECQLDGGGYAPCASAKSYTGLSDGSHTFEVRAIDDWGQVDGSPDAHTWRIDTTAPATPEITSPAEGSWSTSGSVTLSGTAEANATVELSEGAASLGTTTADQSGDWSRAVSFGDGSHEVTATATDAAGNASPSSATRTFWVDTGVPDTSVDSGPSGRVSDTSATFRFSSDDPDATFRCRVDGAAEGPCTSPHDLTDLRDGEHTFEVRAVDAAGNVDSTPASRSWTVDSTAPTVSSVNPAEDATGVDPTADVEATFSEDVTPATLDETTFTLVRQGDSNPVGASVSPGADGRSATLDPSARLDNGATYVARIAGGADGVEDLAGNPLASDRTWSFTTDASPAPDTTIESGPSGTVGSSSASFAFSADLGGSTFECSLDAGTFVPCSSPQSYTGLADGPHSFEVRAISADGVPDPTPAQRNWAVETLLFTDGFELGNFSKWSSVKTGADGTATVQSAIVRSGAHAARLSATGNIGSYAYARRELSTSEIDLTVSGDFRVEQEGASGGNVPFVRLFDAAGTRLVSLNRQNLDRDKVRISHGSTASTTTGRLALGAWGRLRLHVVTAGAGAGTVEVFLDGAEVYRTTAASIGTSGIKTVQIGNETPKQAFTLLVDDVEVRR